MRYTEVNKDQLKQGVSMILAIAEAIRELGRVPSANIYAVVMSKMSLEAYEKAVSILVNAGVVRKDGDVLHWVNQSFGGWKGGTDQTNVCGVQS